MRSDAARYIYMYKHGGIYADLDVECLASHIPLTQCGSVLLPLMGADFNFPHNVPNAWLASVPGHPFWVFVLKDIVKWWEEESLKGEQALKEAYVEAVAGPARVYQSAMRFAAKFKDVLTVSPVRYVEEGLIFPYDWHHRYKDPKISLNCKGATKFPANYTECKHLLGVSKAYSITYWSHSWG